MKSADSVPAVVSVPAVELTKLYATLDALVAENEGFKRVIFALTASADAAPNVRVSKCPVGFRP